MNLPSVVFTGDESGSYPHLGSGKKFTSWDSSGVVENFAVGRHRQVCKEGG